jgi:hypothetical protein
MANVKYNTFGKAIAKNDMDSVTIKAIFFDPSYTPNPDTEVFLSDVVANRAAGTTDLTISGFTITTDNTDNRTEFDIADLVTGVITVPAGTNAVGFYIDTGVAATSEILTYNELLLAGVPTTFFPVGGTLTATINTNGIFSI